ELHDLLRPPRRRRRHGRPIPRRLQKARRRPADDVAVIRMTISKKQKELSYLKSLQYFCDDFPDGELLFDETPDFIIRTKQGGIGIEITEVFINTGRGKRAAQAIEAARERVTSRARDFAQEMGTPPVCVTLFFNPMSPFRREQEFAIARS